MSSRLPQRQGENALASREFGQVPKPGSIPLDFVPSNDDELFQCLSDPYWRLCSGQLYKIKTKPLDEFGEVDESEVRIVPFKPNRAQRKLLKKLHKRNIILKARQLGFTTFIAILFLDCALFAPATNPTTAAIIAHTKDDAEEIFRDKVKFGYDNLPEVLRAVMPLVRDRADALELAHNGSKIRVSTSFRSGTLTHLHISEFGKICAKFPDRATEVVTGSIPAAEMGMIFIESTAEGREGEFFMMCQRAQKIAALGRRLTNKEFAFHFYPWWEDMQYRMDPELVDISKTEHEYFDEIEAKMDTMIDIEQRAWWVSTRDNVYSGQDEKMWQEYPSSPEEAFQKSTEGCYYTKQMVKMRKEKRITTVPYTPGYPVNTFWDIGSGDGTAIWLHQHIGQEHRFIGFIEGWDEPYGYYVRELDKLGYVWGTDYLPHDGNHVRQGQNANLTPKEMLEKEGRRRIEIVERVSELQHGIQITRNMLATAWIDKDACKEGIAHLDSYRKKYNNRMQTFTDQPEKDDGHSEAADALRQWAQVYGSDPNAGRRRTKAKPRRNTSGMAV